MRVLLADDQPKVRYALRTLLEQEPDNLIVGEVSASGELLTMAAQTCPDLVLVDWGMLAAAAVDLLDHLRELCPKCVIIALSGQNEAGARAISAGADFFISKVDPPDQLLAAIARSKEALASR